MYFSLICQKFSKKIFPDEILKKFASSAKNYKKFILNKISVVEASDFENFAAKFLKPVVLSTEFFRKKISENFLKKN